MPAGRRFTTERRTEGADFGQDALLETWRAVLPVGSVLVPAGRVRDRLVRFGKQTLSLSPSHLRRADELPGGLLAALWSRHHDVQLDGGSSVLTVTCGRTAPVAADDLAAAAVAVSGELGFETIRVLRLADTDADATKQLTRALRRLTDIPLTAAVHDRSVEETVTAFASSNLFVTHDETAARIAGALGVPTARTGAPIDGTGPAGLYVALRSAATVVPETEDDVRTARCLAFAMDAWARDRMTTAGLRATVDDPTRVDTLVGA